MAFGIFLCCSTISFVVNVLPLLFSASRQVALCNLKGVVRDLFAIVKMKSCSFVNWSFLQIFLCPFFSICQRGMAFMLFTLSCHAILYILVVCTRLCVRLSAFLSLSNCWRHGYQLGPECIFVTSLPAINSYFSHERAFWDEDVHEQCKAGTAWKNKKGNRPLPYLLLFFFFLSTRSRNQKLILPFE